MENIQRPKIPFNGDTATIEQAKDAMDTLRMIFIALERGEEAAMSAVWGSHAAWLRKYGEDRK